MSWTDVLGQVLGGVAAGVGATGGMNLPGNVNQFDITPGFSIGPQGASALFEPYRSTQSGHSAQMFLGINPTTGRQTWFRPVGRPILMSGDVRIARRVNRLLGRGRRRLGGR